MAPRNPWQLFRFKDLTDEQLKKFGKELQKREEKLREALNAVERALVEVSKALSETNESKYRKKILRTGKTKTKKVRRKK